MSAVSSGRICHDKDPVVVGVPTSGSHPSLPPTARQPINRCNLPAVVLGSLTFQRHPTALVLDGVHALHRELFRRLDAETEATRRAELFSAHMAAVFSLEHPDAAGHLPGARRDRTRASYLRLLRGWAFNANGTEAAVLKGWVESRFGLVPRYHAGPIRDRASETYQRYLVMRAHGLSGTNALEAQLDLLYSYCQYEFVRQRPGQTHCRLYRGVNRVDEYETLGVLDARHRVVLLNSLSSFTPSKERASEFGDFVLQAWVPLPKIFFHPHLLPGLPRGEDEYGVIGGIYAVELSSL